MSRGCLPALVLLGLLVGAGPLAAQRPDASREPHQAAIQTPGLQVRLGFGLGDEWPVHLPLPVTLTAVNQTGASLDGELQVEFYESSDAPRPVRRLSRPLALPPASAKRFHFALDVQGAGVVTLRFRQGRRTCWQQTVNVNAAAGDTDFGVLVIDPRRRAPGLARAAAQASAGSAGDEWLPTAAQRGLRVVTAGPEELPEHEAPLLAFHAVLVSPDVPAAEVTAAQLAALGGYAAGGGLVFVPAARKDWQERLVARLPLPPQRPASAVPGQPLTVQPAGSGRLVCYAGNPFGDSPEAVSLRLAFVQCLHEQDEPRLPRYLEYVTHGLASPATPQVAQSFFLIAALFVVYGVVIGPGMIFLHRARRRTLAVYVLAVVGAFSLGTVLLGVYLRHVAGDLRWASVTELTPDGGRQQALISLDSAGRGQHRLQLAGHAPDLRLQMLGDHQVRYAYQYRNYGNYGNPILGSDYGWLRFDVLDAFDPPPTSTGASADVLLPPWGRRLVFASDVVPALRPVQIAIKLEPRATVAPVPERSATRDRRQLAPAAVAGQTFAIAVTNTSGGPLRNCQLVLGIYTGVTPAYGGNTGQNQDCYQVVGLGDLPPGGSRTLKLPASFDREAYSVNVAFHSFGFGDPKLGAGRVVPRVPRLTHRGQLYALLVARVDRSPGLSIAGGSFVSTPGVHLVCQRLQPEELPDVTSLIAEAPPAKAAVGGIFARPVPGAPE